MSNPAAGTAPGGDEKAEKRRCVVCGCTEDNCRQCIERTGVACSWDPLFKRHAVCTACSHVYYVATMESSYAWAIMSLMTVFDELLRARNFAVRLGDCVRGELIQTRLREISQEI